jgi:hypothetical protein
MSQHTRGAVFAEMRLPWVLVLVCMMGWERFGGCDDDRKANGEKKKGDDKEIAADEKKKAIR